ncbi:5'-nucleotidase, lipoprotein e(P4) family [Flavobacteriaceae bacterium F89]|uniref:5'-nucleotidase, lipoprotein e(P4) family n=1 Tax=Cerina litoralis TaxID=2874477 RepID=A0AAE3JQ52_9FLAO|nr:5'-nucleotidase, lipoprotein e(P4) family [Cerina litoralis]MCG2461489.1 5'-nucleotidase, lipoprotein e(P4) family [Cerina litoralis]
MSNLPKSIYHFSFVILFGLVVACKTQQKSVNAQQNAPIVLQGPAWAAAWQQKAGEYRALCFQAYSLAKTRLDILLQQEHVKPPAIVTDIDETILDNSPYQIHQALQNEEYSDASWMEWTAKIDCDTVPGALSFLRYAKSKGVAIFYITNRLEAERDPTLKDLQRWGFPDAVNDHLTLKTTTSNKDLRRKNVMDNHEVLLLLGDNLGDFSGIFDKIPVTERNDLVQDNSWKFGSRFIVLPNVMYGSWDGAIYNYDHKLSAEGKEKAIIHSLKKY